MLAVILYTGTDCYKDLRDSERRGDYNKWWNFSLNLNSAIGKLGVAQHEKYGHIGAKQTYSGLEDVKFTGKQLGIGNAMNLRTVTSTSRDRLVAEGVSRGGLGFELSFSLCSNAQSISAGSRPQQSATAKVHATLKD